MVINRETAMLLWNKSFGKSSKAKDFAGREMLKAAYDDRDSKYGWNVDHILPKSRGGKTTESNLICCHIKTNDEKADKFPCFTANGKKFEIIKVQNHYEIREIKPSVKDVDSSNNDEDSSINFYDSAAGIRLYKSLKGIQNKKIFVGTVVIDLCGMTTTAIVDFIQELFDDKNIIFCKKNQSQILNSGLMIRGFENVFRVIVKDYNMPKKEDTADILDRCVLLNTYLSCFFKAQGVITQYQIFYGVHTSENKCDALYPAHEFSNNTSFYPLMINELVKINSEAEQKLQGNLASGKDTLSYSVYKYDYVYTKLSENLKKQVK